MYDIYTDILVFNVMFILSTNTLLKNHIYINMDNE